MKAHFLGRRTKAFLMALVVFLAQTVPIGLAPVTAKAASGKPLGQVSTVEEDGGYTAPNTKAYLITTSGNEKVRVVFYKDDMFRIWMADNGTGAFTEAASADIIVKSDFGGTPGVSFAENTAEGYYSFKTGSLTLRAYKSPFRFELYESDNSTPVWKEYAPLTYDANSTAQQLATDASEYFYGGGMQVGSFSHKGNKINIARSGWTEGSAPNPVPFYMSTKGFGIYRNTFQNGTYDFTSNKSTELLHNENRFDAFYIYGPSFEDILDGYTELTGRPSLIPRWGMGLGDAGAYRQGIDTSGQGGNPKDSSSYNPANSPYGGFWYESGTMGVVTDVAGYSENDMPVGWMLPNDGYGCEYNKATHPSGGLGDVAAGLAKYGAKLGLWIGQPGNYTAANYTYGNGTDTGFTNEITAQAKDWGVRLYKIDVAWSSTKNNRGVLIDILKRMYDNIENNSPDNSRGFNISVYGWAGAQRYSTVWSGDQYGTDDYVKYHIPTFTGSSMSGFAYSTSDQAAIFTDNENVYVRDLQMKTLVPMNYAMNNWSSGALSSKRPWVTRRGVDISDINQKYLMLKQQLVPYMYSYARQAYDKGTPIVRPMVYNYQNDPVTYGTKTQYQYMTGDWFLVAPVINMNSNVRDNIYLPEGRWIDYWTGDEYFGPTTISYTAPLDTLPLFVRGGAIIPMAQESLYDGQETYKGKTVNDTIIFDLYPEGKTSFTLYEDDGSSTAYKTNDEYTKTVITTDAPDAGIMGPLTVRVGAAVGNGFKNQVSERKNLFTIHSGIDPGAVALNGLAMEAVGSLEELEASEGGVWFYSGADRGGRLYVKTASRSTGAAATIVVDKYLANTAPELELGLPFPDPVSTLTFGKSSIMVMWPPVEGATVYDLMIDDDIILEGVSSGYLHTGLEPETTHTYRVKARNATQTSGWSTITSGTTSEDPDKYMIPKSGIKASADSYQSGEGPEKAIDGDPSTHYHSNWSLSNANPQSMYFNLGGLYMIDKVTYLPRQDSSSGGNGNVTKYNLYTSLDGTTYTKVIDGGVNDRNNTLKTFTFDPVLASYVKFESVESTGGFMSAAEVSIYRTSQDIRFNSLTTGKEAEAGSVWGTSVTDFTRINPTTLSANTQNYESGGGFFPSNVIDDKADTVWKTRESESLPGSIDIYLSSAAVINRVKYTPPQPGAAGTAGNVTGFELYAVNDSGQTVWLAGGDWADDGQSKVIDFRPVKARSVTFVATSAVGGQAAATEIEIYKEDTGYEYLQTYVDPSSLTATARHTGPDSGAGISNVVDGNLANYWGSNYNYGNSQDSWNKQAWPAYITVDLGKERVITNIKYAARASGSVTNQGIRGYEVLHSIDGESFFLGGRGIASNTSGLQELNFDYKYPARYIRLSTAAFGDLFNGRFAIQSSSSPYAYTWGRNHFTCSELQFFEDDTVEVTPADSPLRALTAAEHGLTASSDNTASGSNASSVLDGDPDTFWESEYSTDNWDTKWPHAITIDLNGKRKINRIEYTPRQASSSGRLRGYEVLYSTDGGATFASAGYGYAFDTTEKQTIAFNREEKVTHIRIQNAVFGEMSQLNATSEISGNNGAYSYGTGNQISIGELSFYEDTSEGKTSVEPAGADPNFAAKYAVDGNMNTAWSSEDGDTPWLTVDLGEQKAFDMARIVWGQEYGQMYKIEASNDGASWNPIHIVSGNTGGTSFYRLTAGEVTARYVRVSSMLPNTAFTIHEFDVFGPETVEAITLDKAEAEMKIGDKLTLKAAIAPVTARDQTVTWSSSEETVASVNAETGVITAKAAGTAVITAVSASNEDAAASCLITVTSVPVESISLDKTSRSMAVGEMTQLEAVVSPSNATIPGVIWSSSDDSIVKVSSNGFVKTLKPGTANITAASVSDLTKAAQFSVTVSDIESVTADNDTGELVVGFTELPTDVLKLLFSVTYSVNGVDMGELTLNNMAVNEGSRSVSFNFDPFSAVDTGSLEIVISAKYKEGQTHTYNTSIAQLQKASVNPAQIVIVDGDEITDVPITMTCDTSEEFSTLVVDGNRLTEGVDQDYSLSGGPEDYTLTLFASYLQQLTVSSAGLYLSYPMTYSFTGGVSDVEGEICFVDSIIEADISNVEAVNGALAVTLDNVPTYKPLASDFTATIEINNGPTEALSLYGFSYDEASGKALFTFKEVPSTEEAQNAAISVSFKGNAAKTSNTFTVEPVILTKIKAVSATNGQLLIDLIDTPTNAPNENCFVLDAGSETITITSFTYNEADKQVIIGFVPLSREHAARTVKFTASYLNNGKEPVESNEFTIPSTSDVAAIVSITAANGMVTAALDFEPNELAPEENFTISFTRGEDVITPVNLELTYDGGLLLATYTFDKIKATTDAQTINVTVAYKDANPVESFFVIQAISQAQLDLQELIGYAELVARGDAVPDAAWNALQAALSNAKDALSSGLGTEAEYNNAALTLKKALNACADKSGLQSKLALAALLNQAQFTAETWQTLQTALQAATAAADSNTALQPEIDAALRALTEAIDNLEAVPQISKAKLSELIKEAETYDASGYTASSWNRLSTALINGKSVYADANAAQDQVDAAASDLQAAINGLIQASSVGSSGGGGSRGSSRITTVYTTLETDVTPLAGINMILKDLNKTEGALGEVLTPEKKAVAKSTADALAQIDPVNKDLAQNVYRFTLQEGSQDGSGTTRLFEITVDVSWLDLTDEQKMNFTGILYDDNLESYKKLGGEFSEDGQTFTFRTNMPGAYGVIIADKLTKISFKLDSSDYVLNGVSYTNDVTPTIIDGRMMLPLRAVSESLGARVDWNEETRTVAITQGESTVTLTIDIPLPDGMGTPVILNGRTLVPVRYIAEQLGASVVWDDDAKTAYIYS